MAGQADAHNAGGALRVGRILFIAGLSIVAVCASFSISLTEGGLLLAWLGLVLESRRAWYRRIIILDYLVLALLVWQLVCAIASPHRAISLRAYRSEWLVMTYFLISFGIQSVEQLGRVLRLLVIAASILAIYGIVQHFTGVDYIKHKTVHTWNNTYKAMGLLGHHITFGVFYAWAFSISLAFLVSASQRLRSRIVWTLPTCLCALAVLYSYSRAAWLGALASFLTVMSLRRFRVDYLVAVLLGVLVIAVLLEPGALQRAVGPAAGETASEGDATRVLLLKTSMRMIAAYPVFGIGPGAFRAAFENFKVAGDYSTTCHAHNDYVNFAVHTGIIGLVILITVMAIVLRGAVHVYRAGVDLQSQRYLLALIGGLVAILVSGLFQCNLTDSEIAIQAWLIIGSVGMFLRTRDTDP
jgi:O-antigen ligase